MFNRYVSLFKNIQASLLIIQSTFSYLMMRECWLWHPMERPSFSEIVEDLDKILSVTADEEYLDLGLPQLETPPSSSDESDDDKDEFPYLL